jgi:hypothetical protein
VTHEEIEKLRTISDELAAGAMRLHDELIAGKDPDLLKRATRSTARYCIELADLLRLYYPDEP